MIDLLLSLLHLLALTLVVRLCLPEKHILLNPYAMATESLQDRLLGFLKSAIPLPTKGLCALLLLAIFAGRAALLTKVGPPIVPLSAMAFFRFPVTGFLGWFGVEVLQFVRFWLAICSAFAVLGLLHLGRPIPGYTGDLLRLGCLPLVRMPFILRPIVVGVLWCGFVSLLFALSGSAIYPLGEIPAVKEAFEQLNLSNPFNLSGLPVALRVLALAGDALFGVIGELQSLLFMSLVLLLLAMLFRAKAMVFFLTDLVRLLCGAIPPMRLGALDCAPLLALLLLSLLLAATKAVWMFLIHGLAYVV